MAAEAEERGMEAVNQASGAPGLSIERKLPLLITGLLVVVLGAALVVTYREVTLASRSAAFGRLRTVTQELAATINANMQQLELRMRRFADDSTVRGAVSGGAVDSATLSAALSDLKTPVDSELRIQLWSADKRPIALTAARLVASPENAPAGVLPALDDSPHVGPLYATGGKVAYWIVSPLRHNGARIGWIAQQRHVRTTPQGRRQVSALIGSDMTLYLRNKGGGIWTTLSGEVVPAATDPRRQSGMLLRTHPATAAGPLLADDAAIGGTPWILSIEQPLRTATASARLALTRLALICLLLLVGGVTAAWLISRRVTRPLVEVTAAAESMARGDYDHRIDVARESGDEIGRLAASFNRMAAEVSAARTELQRQVENAERARHEADYANRAKSAFLATMSHELRTPLNAIAGYTELLELGIHGPVSAEQVQVLGRVRRSQRALLALIEDVLNFARLEAGRMEYRFEEFLLDDVIAGAEAMIAPQARSKGIAIHSRTSGTTLRAWGDPDKVAQIVLNLLSNAVKFTLRGGAVTVHAERRGDDVLVTVADTGRGIARGQVEKIFEPFTQAETGLTRTAEGTGLGLAISREFARAMDGDLSVESEIGRGSTFTLRLPAKPALRSTPRRDTPDHATSASVV